MTHPVVDTTRRLIIDEAEVEFFLSRVPPLRPGRQSTTSWILGAGDHRSFRVLERLGGGAMPTRPLTDYSDQELERLWWGRARRP